MECSTNTSQEVVPVSGSNVTVIEEAPVEQPMVPAPLVATEVGVAVAVAVAVAVGAVTVQVVSPNLIHEPSVVCLTTHTV